MEGPPGSCNNGEAPLLHQKGWCKPVSSPAYSRRRWCLRGAGGGFLMHYYNDNDPKSCAWLRELIRTGEIPDGVVDERSILDVQPADVAGFVQCHFFAGIGGWSLALKLAGWREDKQIWSGSAPCQPYSAAGQGKGDADERNLWPAFFRLIKAGKPECVIGEQVAAAIGHGWLDGICDDLEGEGYTCGAAVLGAHSVGAPHIRQRLYWMAHSQRDAGEPGRLANESAEGTGESTAGASSESGRSGVHGRPAHTNGGKSSDGELQRGGRLVQQPQDEATGGVGNTECAKGSRLRPVSVEMESKQETRRSGNANPWSAFELIGCADGKARRIEPGSKPLVAGVSRGLVPSGDPSVEEAQNSGEARVMRLRGYGNSINVVTAAEFIKASMECC
jgi:DNA (cytosine-5)-methyltransferase 1